MVVTRLNSRLVKMMLAGEIFLRGWLIICVRAGLISRHGQFEMLVGLFFGLAAHVIAIRLYLGIADEYRNVRLSRLVWLAFAANSGLLLLRTLSSNAIVYALIEDYKRYPLRGFFNHIFSVPASIVLLLGLLGMLQSYRHAGLGTKLRGRDYALIAASVALFGWLLVFHKNLEEGQSPWAVNRVLQPVDLFLIAAGSIASIVLHRYTAVMQGGKMAVVLRWLVFYVLSAGVLVLLNQIVVPLIQRTVLFDATPLLALWSFLPWLTALAAATRAEMTAEAVAQVATLKQAEVVR
jgi:hypothetical protein